MNFNIASNKHLNTVFKIVIMLGICLSIFQFIDNRSLWLDEASLALNIVNKSFLELAKPLDYDQIAPIGFLYIEKIFANVFGNSDLSLRIFPLLTFLLSLPLLYKLSKEITENKLISLLTVSAFSINFMLLTYATEVKQYSSDVLIAIAIIYSALILQKNYSTRNLIYYSLITAVSIWFSNIAVIMIAVSGIYLLYYEYFRNKSKSILIPLALSIISFGIYYALFIRNHPLAEYMRDFWKDFFMPFNPFNKDFYSFIYSAFHDFYYYNFSHGPIWMIPFGISLIGVFSLYSEKLYKIIYFVFAPLIVHFILSAFKLYPFNGRLVLYLVPMFTTLYAIGIYKIFKVLIKRIPSLNPYLLLLPISLFVLPLIKMYPKEKEEIKPIMEYVNARIQPNDKVYVYYSAMQAYKFYQNRFINLSKYNYFIGASHRDNYPAYIEEIGTSVTKLWIIFSHVHPFNSSNNEETFIVNSLKNKFKNLKYSFQSKGASAYYFE